MTRKEIREKFRAENPEVTTAVVSDATMNGWLLTANDEVCCMTRCIVSEDSEVIQSVVGTRSYDLEDNIDKFYAIDDMPGGGVYYDDKPLKKSSPGEMNNLNSQWRVFSNGTPKRYWRRGKMLFLDRPPDTAGLEIALDVIFRPDSFNDDAQEPFNGLGFLQSFSDALNKYIQWRTKAQLGKEDESKIAFNDYQNYVAWMKKEVGSSKYGPIAIQPKR